MSDKPQLLAEFESLEHLREQMSVNLLKGRAYVAGEYRFQPRQACDLILIHPESGEWMPLSAEVVYQCGGASPGIGLELLSNMDLLSERLKQFASSTDALALQTLAPSGGSELPYVCDLDDTIQVPPSSGNSLVLESIPPSAPPSSIGDRQLVPAQSPAERVRGLSAAGRDRVARKGTLAERVALERAFGPAVWESLLSNPLLSTGEVARIAKNHTASQPILISIAANSNWLVKPEVRRALLSNPRLPEAQIERTLRALSHSELKLVFKQAAYPIKVRNAAKKILGI